jgi:hypothetical protein
VTVERGDWSFVDLSGADLRGSDLSAVDPREVELAGAQVDVTQAVVLVTTLGLRVRPDVPEWSRTAGVAAHGPGGILADERATDPDDRSAPHAHRDP